MLATSHIADLVRSAISSPEENTAQRFEEIALEIFATQYQANLPYQRYANLIGTTPDTVTSWQEIPAVPTKAFKQIKHPLTCHPGKIAARFLTSGTTTEIKGEHLLPATDLYQLSLTQSLAQSSLPPLTGFTDLHFLSPSSEEAPHSSLSHMFGTLAQDGSHFLMRDGRFQLAPLFQLSGPSMIMGTALGFLHLMESHQPITLPQGSHLVETGGYKGTSRALEKGDLYQQLAHFFSIPQEHIHNEYGMTELSSQAYATGSSGSHRFPWWCQANVISPVTGKETPKGELGYLRIVDLANAYTVTAIQTQDLAVMNDDASFQLMGRDPSALPRGCSRASDDTLNS